MRPYPYMRMQKPKKKTSWMTYFIIIIMVASIGGFLAGYSTQETQRYNNIKFTQQQNAVTATIEGKTYMFGHFPGALNPNQTDSTVRDLLTSTHMVYIAYNPESLDAGDLAQAQYALIENLEQTTLYIQPALTTNNTFTMPVITCANATASVPVILFEEGNTTTLSRENTCIRATYGHYADIPLLRDLIVYTYLGVLP